MPSTLAPPSQVEPQAELRLTRPALVAVTIAVLAANFLAALEGTVVGTAMPTIVSDLGGLAYYSWVFTAYMLSMTVTVPLWGKLSDIYGRREIYLVSVAIFVVGSACSGQARTMPELIFWRCVQGLGGGALTPVGQAILGEVYTLEARARVQAWLTTALGLASAVGPLVGGFIAQHMSWRWVFYLNLPFALAGGALLLYGLPRGSGRARGAALDLAGAGLFTAASVLLLVGLQFGPATPVFAGAAIVSAGLLAAFWRTERRAADPMIAPGLFAERMVVGTSALLFFLGMGLYGGLSFLPLFYQAVLGQSASQAGQSLTPLLLAWMGVALFAPRLVLRYGYRLPIGMGAVSFMAGYVLLIGADRSTSPLAAMGAAALLGASGGLCFSPTMLGAQSVVSREDLGVVSSVVTFSRNIGGAVGVAVMGAVLSTSIGGHGRAEALSNPAVVGLLDRGLEHAFYVGLFSSVLCLACLAMIPRGRAGEIRDEAHRRHLQAAAGLHAGWRVTPPPPPQAG